MIGLVHRFLFPEDAIGLSRLIENIVLPLSEGHTEINIPDLSAYPFLDEAGLSGPALVISSNRVGGFVSLEIVLFEKLINRIKRLTSGEGSDRLFAKARLMADLGNRSTSDHLEALPEGLRAPRGGRRGDLLWHTGIGWERLQGEGGAVMMTTPQGDPAWLPVADFVERLELACPAPLSAEDAPEATSFKRRSESIESASVSDLLSRLPVVWYSLGGSEQDERLRPAMLMPGTDSRGDQRLIVFLSPDDRDWIALNDGQSEIQRTGAEGRTPGTWRRI